MMRFLPFVFATLLLAACNGAGLPTAQPTPTPDLPATIEAAVRQAIPTATPTPATGVAVTPTDWKKRLAEIEEELRREVAQETPSSQPSVPAATPRLTATSFQPISAPMTTPTPRPTATPLIPQTAAYYACQEFAEIIDDAREAALGRGSPDTENRLLALARYLESYEEFAMARATERLGFARRSKAFHDGLTGGRQMARLCDDRGYHHQIYDEVDVVVEYVCAGSTLGRNVRISPGLGGWSKCEAGR